MASIVKFGQKEGAGLVLHLYLPKSSEEMGDIPAVWLHSTFGKENVTTLCFPIMIGWIETWVLLQRWLMTVEGLKTERNAT